MRMNGLRDRVAQIAGSGEPINTALAAPDSRMPENQMANGRLPGRQGQRGAGLAPSSLPGLETGLGPAGPGPEPEAARGPPGPRGHGVTAAADQAPDPARLLGDFAKVLKETAEKASMISHFPARSLNEGGISAATVEAAAMPQILHPKTWSHKRPDTPRWNRPRLPEWLRLRRGMKPPSLAVKVGVGTLALLAAINLLVGYQAGTESVQVRPASVAIADVRLAINSALPGAEVVPNADRKRDTNAVGDTRTLTPGGAAGSVADQEIASRDPAGMAKARDTAHVAAVASIGSDVVRAVGAGGVPPGVVVPAQEAVRADLLAASARLVASGDISAARTVLAKSAAAGDVAARFALAETYDPNMLAAWGRREPVADVHVARTLYRQALAAGDSRAIRRIEALGGTPEQ